MENLEEYDSSVRSDMRLTFVAYYFLHVLYPHAADLPRHHSCTLEQHSSKCVTQELLTLLVPGTTFSLAKGSQISSSRAGLLSPLLSKLWANAELSHYHVLYEGHRQHVPLRMQPLTLFCCKQSTAKR